MWEALASHDFPVALWWALQLLIMYQHTEAPGR